MTSEITNLQFFTNNHSTMVGNVMVTFNDDLTIKASMYSGDKGLAVLWPADKYEKDGKTQYSRKVLFAKAEDEKFSAIQQEFDNQIIEGWNNFVQSAPTKAKAPAATSTKDRVNTARAQNTGGARTGAAQRIPF